MIPVSSLTRREQRLKSQAEQSPFCLEVREMCRHRLIPLGDPFEFPAAKWLEILNLWARENSRNAAEWPKNAIHLARRLNQYAEGLKFLGVTVRRRQACGWNDEKGAGLKFWTIQLEETAAKAELTRLSSLESRGLGNKQTQDIIEMTIRMWSSRAGQERARSYFSPPVARGHRK